MPVLLRMTGCAPPPKGPGAPPPAGMYAVPEAADHKPFWPGAPATVKSPTAPVTLAPAPPAGPIVFGLAPPLPPLATHALAPKLVAPPAPPSLPPAAPPLPAAPMVNDVVVTAAPLRSFFE